MTGMTGMTGMTELESFVDRLLALELDARTLREDPRGETWLPADMRASLERDPECAREFDEFVATELALFDVREPCDAFFTKQVMQQLPEIEAVDDQRRTWILASAYALAIGVAYLLLGPLLGSGGFELGEVFASLRTWSENHAIEAGGAGLAIGLLIGTAALLVLPIGSGRRAADA
ncbi:hypothetical protein ACNOYE_27125 [Nannocystaceae bacterium ST9]